MQQELFKLQWEQMLGALWLYVSSVNPILIRDCKFMEGEKLQSIHSQEVSNAYHISNSVAYLIRRSNLSFTKVSY